MITDEEKRIQKVEKARKSNKHHYITFLLECNFAKKESIEIYVQKVDKTAQKLIKQRRYDGALHVLGQCENDLATKCGKPEPLLQLNIMITKAQLRTDQNDLKKAMDDLKTCYRLSQNKKCKKTKQGDILINLANTCNSLGHQLEALNYSSEAVQVIQEYQPESDTDMVNQLDLLVQALVLNGGLKEKSQSFIEAAQTFYTAKGILGTHFGEFHPQFEIVEKAITRIQPKAEEQQKWAEVIKNKNGKVVRSYIQETDQVQNQDLRHEIVEGKTSFDDFLESTKGKGHRHNQYCADHCMIHSGERNYQNQLLQMRAMQDEQFRIEQLLLARKKYCLPPPVVKRPVYKRPKSTTSSSSSSSSSDSSSSESQKATSVKSTPKKSRAPTPKAESSSDEETDWVTSYPFPHENLPIDLKIEGEEIKQISQIHTLAPAPPLEVKVGTRCQLIEKQLKNDYHKKQKQPQPQPPIKTQPSLHAIIFIQARIRKFLNRIRKVVACFYMRDGQNVARITVFTVQLKSTKIHKHVHMDKEHHVTDQHTEITGVKQFVGYCIIAENLNSPYQHNQTIFEKILKEVDEKKEIFKRIIQQDEMPPRNYLIDYLRKAIKLTWKVNVLVKFEYRMLKQFEINEITENVEELIRNIKVSFAIGFRDHANALHMENEDQKNILNLHEYSHESHLGSGQVTEDVLGRVKSEAIAIANSQPLDKEDLRTKIEWQARQIMSRKGGPSSQKIFLQEKIIDQSLQVKVIKLNASFEKFVPTFVQLAPKVNIAKVVRVQAWARGWLVRKEIKEKKNIIIGCYSIQVEAIYFLVKVYLVQKSKVMITVQNSKIKANILSKIYTALPLDDIHILMSYIKLHLQIYEKSEKLVDFDLELNPDLDVQVSDKVLAVNDDSDDDRIVIPIHNGVRQDYFFMMIQRLIKFDNPKDVKFQFNIVRNGIEFLGKYLKYRGQKIVILWRRDDLTDCDYLVLAGKNLPWKPPKEVPKVPDTCCCDNCCTGCGKCLGAVFCCFSCVNKNKGATTVCSCCKKIACCKYAAESHAKLLKETEQQKEGAKKALLSQQNNNSEGSQNPQAGAVAAVKQKEKGRCCTCDGPCCKCMQAAGRCICNCPGNTCKAICSPCQTAEKCLDCTGLLICGCVERCQKCCKRSAKAMCQCIKKSCTAVFCTLPKCIGSCIVNICKKTKDCLCNCCTRTGDCCRALSDCLCNCPMRTTQACINCSIKCCNCCKRTTDKICCCFSKKCKKRCLKCWKCLFCCCCCLDKKKKKKKEDKKNDNDDYKEPKFKLKGKELKEFIIENLLVFWNQNRIGYIALDNKDRLEYPGDVLVEFLFRQFQPQTIEYIVRMLVYKNVTNPLALTVHKVGDTTDCDKISFERSDVIHKGDALEAFIRRNLLIWLKEDNSRRIKNIALNNSKGLFGKLYDERLVIKIQARVRSFIHRRRYMKIMYGVVCIYYVARDLRRIARITVKKVLMKQTRTEKHVKEHIHHETAFDAGQKVGQEVEIKETSIQVEGYQIIAENALNREKKIEKLIKSKLPKFPIDYLRKALTVEWKDEEVVKLMYKELSESDERDIARQYKQAADKMKSELITWLPLKTWSPGEGQIFSLFKAEIENMNQPYLQIVYQNKNKKILKELSLKDCALRLKVSTKLGFVQMMEKCNYVENLTTYEKMLQCYSLSNDQKDLVFDPAKFGFLRFGFRIGEVKAKLDQDTAVRILQRAVRRWINRKRLRVQRRTPGYMSLTNVVRLGNHCLVYVMLADRSQKVFKITVKEKNTGQTVVSKHKVSQETISKTKPQTYILPQIEAVLKDKLLNGDQSLQAIAQRIRTI